MKMYMCIGSRIFLIIE